jgi:hypothetical protein
MLAKQEKILLIKDRIETCRDFTINLLLYIDHYYIDKESLSDDTDIKNHYNFCYDKTCDDFEKEHLYFRSNSELKNYYFGIYYNQYYKLEKPSMKMCYKFWNDDIFNINNFRNKNVMELLIELYEIFNISLNKKYI